MAVKFISHVEQDELGGWYIKLTDTLEESEVICKDLDEYSKQIEQLGGLYGGEIEVVWTKSKLLTPSNYQELNDKMRSLQEKYQDEINKINEQNSESNNELSGFNPNV